MAVLPHNIVTGDKFLAAAMFRAHHMLVLDDVPWDADLKVIHSGLVKKRRAFKEDYVLNEPTKLVRKQVRNVITHAERLFAQIYPTFKSIETRTSFRPMITGPEPLHFDTYGGPNPMVTAYINVSKVPRIYGIGPNFPTLVREQRSKMVEMMEAAAERNDVDLSYVLREHPHSPMINAPRHRIELDPGTIWFFNAKTVSHEVIYGEGAVGISWEVPGCGAKSQSELLKELA